MAMKNQKPYHHGNLKEALLDASVQLIREVGAEAFTLREVARRAGVSHNAPYRHFADKGELLAAVAAEGFDRLTESMRRAAASGNGALDRLRLSGRGYVRFALRYPQHFTVMFEAPERFEALAETRVAGERSFNALVQYVEECQQAGTLPPGESKPVALIAWSLVHGVAKLAVGGLLPFSGIDEILDFTDAATHALQRGISNAVNANE